MVRKKKVIHVLLQFTSELPLAFGILLQLVELKNGETYNGHLVSCDNWMNINLREVICTSRVSIYLTQMISFGFRVILSKIPCHSFTGWRQVLENA
jgi:hypothetical protein